MHSNSTAPPPAPARPQVWPVIHLNTPEVAYANADLAFRLGCSGVFVISMDGKNHKVTPVALEIKRRYPDRLVGVNYLGMGALASLGASLDNGLDATWTDSPGVSSSGVTDEAEQVASRLLQHPDHLFFGSVAFKYQPEEPDPPAAAIAASRLGMIATTSGTATGSPPSAAKLHAMRIALGGAPLAVASGIDPVNGYELGRFLTHVLVATGVSRSFYEFDERLLSQLLDRLQDF